MSIKVGQDYSVVGGAGHRGCLQDVMTDGEKLLKLIEEMVELKVQLHSGVPIGNKPGLVQLVAKKRFEDQQRLGTVREQIVSLFNG